MGNKMSLNEVRKRPPRPEMKFCNYPSCRTKKYCSQTNDYSFCLQHKCQVRKCNMKKDSHSEFCQYHLDYIDFE